MTTTDDFFDRTAERPDIVAGRYRLPHPVTGAEQSWTRATTHAELPEDSYALTRWQMRQLVRGLRLRTDLLRLIEGWPADPTDAECDEVIGTAHEVAGNDARANLGTAAHGVLQRVDEAWHERDAEGARRVGQLDAFLAAAGVPEWALQLARSYVVELCRHGLSPVPGMVERRVINVDLGCAGTLDNLYREADGTLALGDKKTGRVDGYTERKFAVQLAVYLGASHMLHADGAGTHEMAALNLRRDYAVLVHVDPEAGACSVYRVDMRRGQLGANVAADVREWRRQRHLLLPYVAPAAQAAADGVVSAAIGKPPRVVGEPESPMLSNRPAPMVAETRVIGDEVQQFDGQNWAYVGPATTPPDPGNEHSANSTTAALGDALAASNGAGLPRLRTRADLERKRVSKAELQTYCRAHGMTDLAHNKPQLLDALERAGKLAPPSDVTDYSAGRTYAAPATDPGVISSAQVSGEDPTDPRSPAFHRARLAEIAAARTVGELGRIHATVTRVGGDQAWTDAMTEAARTRTAELDAAALPAPPTIEWGGAVVPVDQVIDGALSSQEMARVWTLTTLGGSAPERWTDALNERAHARLAWLQAEAEQRPPATPFGSPA